MYEDLKAITTFMATTLLLKFALNDIPHAIGFNDESVVPDFLLRKYPWLKGLPKSVWINYWPFPAPPIRPEGSMPWATEHFIEIDRMAISTELKQIRWADLIMKHYHRGLLTEKEKDTYLRWEF